MRTLAFTLGVILTAYCCAGVLSESLWQNNDHANRVLCRVFLCDNAPLVWHARDLVSQGKKEDIPRAIAIFRTVLQRDAQDPNRWADLGDAFLDAGQKKDARYCYGQVLVIAPRTAVFLLRAANFYFRIGEDKEALPITARVLRLVPDYDSAIFGEYIHFASSSDDILQFGIPEDRRAAQSWMQFLLKAGRPGDAQRTWDWVVKHGYADDALAGKYAEFLIRQGQPDSASSMWTEYLGARADGYGKSDFLFNGDFEAEPAPSPFDWNIGQANGVKIARDCKIRWSGRCSLHISFAGTENLGFAAASQLAFVRPGSYRFLASIRTEGLTTDQGIRFRISDAKSPANLDQVFGDFTGSNPWTSIEHDLAVPPKTRLLRIEIVRQPSMKFDNKVGGTAWIDALKLESITPQSPR